jgi:predicted amidophosphoribosyltransferase
VFSGGGKGFSIDGIGKTSSATVLCPFCAEEIKPAAIVCKHCGRDLPKRS